MSSIHQLPEMFNSCRVLSDEQARALTNRVGRASFAHSGDALVRLHNGDVGTLVEHHARGCFIEADPRDLH